MGLPFYTKESWKNGDLLYTSPSFLNLKDWLKLN